MHKIFKTSLLAAALLSANAANAATLDVQFEIPTPTDGKGASPYVAIWAEKGSESKHLLVWHLKNKQDEWLSDLRRWWRKIGRYDNYPDALTGATRKAGSYTESLDVGDWNKFKLYFEVVRENGGRSLLKTDVDLTSNTSTYHIPADSEIGDITIQTNH